MKKRINNKIINSILYISMFSVIFGILAITYVTDVKPKKMVKSKIVLEYTADEIPDPYMSFPTGKFSKDVKNDSYYILKVEDFSEKQLDRYLSACKNYGFNDIGYGIGAYTSEMDYWTQIQVTDKHDILYIITQKMEDKHGN